MLKWLFGKKRRKREEELLEMYERGEYLHVDDGTDNKSHLEEKKISKIREEKEVDTEELIEEEVPEEEVKPLKIPHPILEEEHEPTAEELIDEATEDERREREEVTKHFEELLRRKDGNTEHRH